MVKKITEFGSGAPFTNGGSVADVAIVREVPRGASFAGRVMVPVMPGSVGNGIGTPVCVAGTEIVA